MEKYIKDRHCLIFHAVLQAISAFRSYSNKPQASPLLVHSGAAGERLGWAGRTAQGKNKRSAGARCAAGYGSATADTTHSQSRPDRPRTTSLPSSLPGQKQVPAPQAENGPSIWFSQKANQSLDRTPTSVLLKEKPVWSSQVDAAGWHLHHPGAQQQPVLPSSPTPHPKHLTSNRCKRSVLHNSFGNLIPGSHLDLEAT